jgi:hypothetical protein
MNKSPMAVILLMGMTAAVRADVVIVADETPTSVIYVDAHVMCDEKIETATHAEARAEKERVRLRESVKDLAAVIERISGAAIPICASAPPELLCA